MKHHRRKGCPECLRKRSVRTKRCTCGTSEKPQSFMDAPAATLMVSEGRRTTVVRLSPEWLNIEIPIETLDLAAQRSEQK